MFENLQATRKGRSPLGNWHNVLEIRIKAAPLLDLSPREIGAGEGTCRQGVKGTESPFSGSYTDADKCSFQMIDSPTCEDLS